MPEYVPAEKLDLGGMYCEGVPGSYVSCVPPEEVPERQSMDEPGLSSGQWPDSSSYDASYFSGMGWTGLAQTISPEEIGASAWKAFFSAEPHSGATAEIIGSGGFALIVLGLCLLVAAPLRWIALPVAAMGSMPLTSQSSSDRQPHHGIAETISAAMHVALIFVLHRVQLCT